jgi:predicted nucleic acid-binding protein
VALLSPGDELYSRAQRWAAVVREPLVTTEYVLWELLNSLSDPIDRPKVHAAVAEIQSSASWDVLPATPALFIAGIKLHHGRPDKHWSLTDCVSFVAMQQRGLSRALAFDHHFEQAGFDALLRLDPP